MSDRLGAPFAVWGLAATLARPALNLWLRSRVRTGKEWPERLGERRGLETSARPDGRLIWLHAASVGETLSLLPLLAALQDSDPALNLLLTTGTTSAQTLAEARLAMTATSAGPTRLLIRFVPLDVPAWIGRFLDHWRPDMLVLVESELWPSLIAGCTRRHVRLVLLNARLSARSARRWARAGFLLRRLLQPFALISARSPEDAERLRALGLIDIECAGDLKQAADMLPHDPVEAERLSLLIGDRPVWLAASTHAGEEEVVARLHAALSAAHPDLLTILVPRHPQRADAVARLLPGAPRRSLKQDPPVTAGIWLCDTLGELGLFYRLVKPVLLGNSLDEVRGSGGGHNPLEPARLGCALGSGPKLQNFEQSAASLIAAAGLVVLPDEAAIRVWLDRMLADPAARERQAAAAISAVAAADTLALQLAHRLLAVLALPAS